MVLKGNNKGRKNMASKRDLNKYEIEIDNNWIKTDLSIFITWSGLRKLNGEFYFGSSIYYDPSLLYSA